MPSTGLARQQYPQPWLGMGCCPRYVALGMAGTISVVVGAQATMQSPNLSIAIGEPSMRGDRFQGVTVRRYFALWVVWMVGCIEPWNFPQVSEESAGFTELGSRLAAPGDVLKLKFGPIVEGQATEVRVLGADPEETVGLIGTLRGPGIGPCPRCPTVPL